jgi:hypothetical protein
MQEFRLQQGLISAISSSMIVPFPANSNFPGFLKAPRSWPNSSDSNNSAGNAAQFTFTKGARRAD